MEPKELSPALLQPQVTVVATLGELVAALPTWQEEETLLESPKRLHRDLEEFTRELRVTLHRTEDTWRHRSVTSDDDDPVTSLSQALAAYKSTPWTTRKRVTLVASKWQGAVAVLVDSWAQLAGKATKVRDTCREVATKVADVEATATAQARELQAEAAHYGTAQEHSMELGQALGEEEGPEVVAEREARVRREPMVAASEARRATMERQRLEAALGLLERLVAACDEATAFPRELQRRIRDIKAALKGRKKKVPDVPEDLVAKAAEAEWLWEASARLARGHLLGAVDDIIVQFHSKAGPSASGVAERCQRAIEDIPRLLRAPERPQGVPEESPLSPALLQPQVTVVATLGELLATLPMWEEEETLLESRKCLHRDLEEFTKELRVTLHRTEDTWRHRSVTSLSHDDDPVTSLSRVMAAYKITPRTTRDDVAMVASKWQGAVAVLVDSWARLAGKATKVRDTCREVATEVADVEATATAWGRKLQAKAAHYGTAQEHRVELGQALGEEEGPEVVAGREAQVKREPMVAASEARRATMERQQLEAALGLLEHLVAACDEATAFPRELQRRVRDIKAALKGTKKKVPDVPEDLVAKAAEAERLWEASARLARGHLLGAVDDIIIRFHSKGGHARPGAREVAKRCQRAIEDIPKLLQE